MDKRIPEILNVMNDNDIIIFTADHGTIQLIKEQIIQENMYQL